MIGGGVGDIVDVVLVVNVGELLRFVVGYFGKDEGREAGGAAGGRGGVFSEDGGTVGYAGAVESEDLVVPVEEN